jgi:hypothetical protein
MNKNLNDPPIGGEVRQSPWEALGISRATWYRRGKPAESWSRPTQKMAIAGSKMSLRTFQRMMRIIRKAPQLRPLCEGGKMKLGFADQLVSDPVLMAAFDRWQKEAIVAFVPADSVRERRNDLAAQAVADHIGPCMTVEEVDEALNRLRARGTYEQIINQMSEPT